jgi:hypothetical protein
MMRYSIIEVFGEAWGDRPSRLVSADRPVSRRDLDSLIDVWQRQPEETGRYAPEANQIWPLISHHTYGSRSLFRPGAVDSILPRVLTILLAHDGIVAADPLADIELLIQQGKSDEALMRMPDILEGLAKTEALIESDILRFSRNRPKLSDRTRLTLLDFFGLDPSLQVFTNFVEAAVTVQELPGSFERVYRPQLEELFRLLGLPSPPARNLDEALGSVRDLAAAVLEVTWQMAVCAADPMCDLALTGPTEIALAESLLGAGHAVGPAQVWSRGLGRTRHMERMNVGDLPNLSAGLFNVRDAIAIRTGDAYQEFRQSLRAALDAFDDDLRFGKPVYVARSRFEEAMAAASVTLSEKVRKATLREIVRDSSIPVAIGTISAFSFPSQEPAIIAGTGIVTGVTAVVSRWIGGRSTPGDVKVARRYASILSGEQTSN